MIAEQQFACVHAGVKAYVGHFLNGVKQALMNVVMVPVQCITHRYVHFLIAARKTVGTPKRAVVYPCYMSAVFGYFRKNAKLVQQINRYRLKKITFGNVGKLF
ncbi:hypothetical protein D3C76_1648500 [compost metagenome]